jgi:hypothetical protein
MFCDAPDLFRTGKPTPWKDVLFGAQLDLDAVKDIAMDTKAETRVRILAFNILRQNRQPVVRHMLLGVVSEFPFEAGLDAVAAYEDGRIRYTNQGGMVGFVDSGHPAMQLGRQMLAAASPIADRVASLQNRNGDQPRRPPPTLGNARLTLLMSDGRYMLEAPATKIVLNPMMTPAFKLHGEIVGVIVSHMTKADPAQGEGHAEI